MKNNRHLESKRIRIIVAAILSTVACAVGAEEPRPPKPSLSETVRPRGYVAELRLDPRQPAFEGTMRIDLAFDEAADLLWLNATELDIETATLAWQGREIEVEPVAGSADFLGFRFLEPVGPGEGTLTVSYRGTLSQDPQGLFRWEQDGDWYLVSRFEPTHARHAFPCFDEPRFQAPWTLILDMPAEMTALTNTLGARARTRLIQAPPTAAEAPDRADETAPPKRRLVPARTWIRYYPTPPIPSHDVALAVGPFDVAQMDPAGAKRVAPRIFTPRGRASEAAHLQQILPRILASLEAESGTSYPHGKLDLLALPGTGDAAAVNGPGLVSFDQGLLIADGAQETSEAERRAATFLARELARQWPDRRGTNSRQGEKSDRAELDNGG